MLLWVPSLPICLSLLAPAVWGTRAVLPPTRRGTGGAGFVGCCLQEGPGSTAEPLLLRAGARQEAGEGEERAGWGARGQILHPCKPEWG